MDHLAPISSVHRTDSSLAEYLSILNLGAIEPNSEPIPFYSKWIEIIMNDEINALELAAELTAAWLVNSNTRTNADDVPAFLRSMHAAVA